MNQYQLPYQNYGAPSGQSNFGGSKGVKSGTDIFGGVSDQSNPFGANAATAQGTNPVAAAVGNATAALTGTGGSAISATDTTASTPSTADPTTSYPNPNNTENLFNFLNSGAGQSYLYNRPGGGGSSPTAYSAAFNLNAEQKLGQSLDPNLLSVAGPNWKSLLSPTASPDQLGGMSSDVYIYGPDTIFK